MQLRVDRDLHLEGRNKDDKEFTSAGIANVKITGQPVTTALNREYLQTALRCGLDEIRIHTELEPLLFLKPGKRMVVMPVRLNGLVTQTVPGKPAAPPTPTAPKPEAEAPTERKTEMPKTTAPNNAEPKVNVPEPDALKSALNQIEAVRVHLRESLGGLNHLTGLLKQIEKDNRATEKEVASVRQTLRSLQGLKL